MGKRHSERFFKNLERFGKRCLISLARWVFRLPTPSVLDTTKCHRILVVRQDNRLGNLVLIEPFLRALRGGLPQAHVALVVAEKFAELYLPGVLVDEVIVFPHSRLAQNPLRLLAWLRAFRRRRWDLAIDSAHPRTVSATNLLLVACSAARWRLGFTRDGSERFFNLTVPAPSPGSYIEEQLLLLRPLGIEASISRPRLGLPAGHEILARKFRQALGLGECESVCGVWIGGRYDKRRDLSEFVRLYRHFEDEQPRRFFPVLLSGPDEEVTIERGVRHYRFTGPIWELAAALKTLAWFLSMDSGPRHLAAALDVPSIGLFRGGAQAEYGHADGRNHFDFSVDHEPDLFSKVLLAVEIIHEKKTSESPNRISTAQNAEVEKDLKLAQ
ncbi:MAG: glycosyltransferase family 9 protein [bacterium]